MFHKFTTYKVDRKKAMTINQTDEWKKEKEVIFYVGK